MDVVIFISAVVVAVVVVISVVVKVSVGVLIIESGVAVDLLMDAFTVVILGVPVNVGVNMSVGVNLNVFADVMKAFGFVMPDPSEEFRCCWAAFDCRPMAALTCASAFLQAWMPSYHV